MEVKFVDVNHGYAAFAPEKPISESQNAHDDSPFAFLPGDVVATERPVVCWQQMISRYPTAPVSDHSETANSDIEGSSGGGIFRSCAYCLNSLLTVAEEAARLESIVDSERNACRSPPSGVDVSVRDLFLQTVIQNAFVEFLPSSSEDDLVSCSTSSSSSPVRGREINQLGGEEQMNSLRRYRAVTWKRSTLALSQQRSTSPPNARDAQEDDDEQPNAWASACYMTAIPSHSLDVCVSLPSSSKENRTMQLEEGEQGVMREGGIPLAGERKEEEDEGYEKKAGKQAKGNAAIPFSAPPPSYSLLLRSVKQTQRHVVLYDGSVEGNEVPPHTESEGKDHGGVSDGAWILSFCDCVCLASFEREFGASRWLLGQKVVGSKRGEIGNTSGTNCCEEEEKAVEEEKEEERDGDCEDTTFYDGYDNMGASCFSMNLARDPNAMPTSTRVDPHLKALFSQYFLFDESFNSRALQKCFGHGDEDTSTSCNDGGKGAGGSSDHFASLASSPLVAELRSEVWDLICTDFIINGRRSSSTVKERQLVEEERDLVKRKQEEVHGLGNSEMQQRGHENGTGASESATSCATDHQHAALGRCLMAIYTLSSTFNERFKMILLVVCKALTSLLETSDTRRLSRLPHPSSSSSGAADGRNPTNLPLIVSIFSRLEAHLLDSFCASYEEGPFRKYTWRQRETLRAFCTLLNEWLSLLEVLLLSQEEVDCQGLFSSQQKRRYVSIQTVQTISMVLDANAHACVVLNPIYAAICGFQQQLDIETADVNRNEVNEEEKEKRIFVSGEKGRNRNENESIRKMPNGSEPLDPNRLDRIRTSDASLSLSILIHRFASPNLHHNLGVALYDRCTKINHSCRPNVKFIPTFAPVRAVVVARGVAGALLHNRAAAGEEDARERRDDKGEMKGIGGSGAGGIIWGEEIRTSYLDIDEEFSEKRLFESLTLQEDDESKGTTDRSVVNNERRRRFLRENYGFECDCLRCVEDKS